MRFSPIISNDKGLTIVEVLASFAIIVIAVVGIYLGLLYAESQINRNYHERVAALLASGECNWQYYYRVTFREFDTFIGREVTINSFPGTDYPPLKGIMTMEINNNTDIIFGRTVPYQTIRVQIAWNEPLLGEKVMVVQEDFFR